MLWIDRLEKLGRLLLWLALAATIVLVPIGLAKERRTEADTVARVKDATRASEEKLAALEKSQADKTQRITLASIGTWLSALSVDSATGQMWFTNVSPRAGYVCVVAEATNPTTHATSLSLPGCAEVPAYASGVRITVMFAGRDLSDNCKAGACSLSIKDAAEAKL
jgi:hypothetical protein